VANFWERIRALWGNSICLRLWEIWLGRALKKQEKSGEVKSKDGETRGRWVVMGKREGLT
jgi:hypothetical protein